MIAARWGIDGRSVLMRLRHTVTPNHRFATCQQFPRLKGFDHVIICPQFQAGDLIGQLIAGGHHDDGRGIPNASQSLAQLQAILARQHQVKQYQGNGIVLEQFKGLLAALCNMRLEAANAQFLSDQFGKFNIIFNNEYTAWGAC